MIMNIEVATNPCTRNVHGASQNLLDRGIATDGAPSIGEDEGFGIADSTSSVVLVTAPPYKRTRHKGSATISTKMV